MFQIVLSFFNFLNGVLWFGAMFATAYFAHTGQWNQAYWALGVAAVSSLEGIGLRLLEFRE